MTDKLDDEAVRTLNDGGKVLLSIRKGSLAANCGGDVAIGFPAYSGILHGPKDRLRIRSEYFATRIILHWLSFQLHITVIISGGMP